MAPNHRPAGRQHASFRLALALLVALLTALAAAPSPAVEVPRELLLEPDNAPAGAEVLAVATGFGRCPPVDDVGGVGSVVFAFDGQQVGSAPVVGVSATGTFVVPPGATEGEHRVQAVCPGNTTLTAAAGFVVTPAVPDLVLVPDLAGRSLDEARELLAEAGLELGEVFGEDGLVEDQIPDAGAEVARGSPVGVVLAGLVIVPPLAGLTLEEAARTLGQRGLILGEVVGDGETVRTQSPAEGVGVPPGSGVSVDFGTGPSPPVVTVEVPRLKGLTVAEARTALATRGLGLADAGLDPDAGADAVVALQSPPAGALVPVDSAVAVSLVAATPGSTDPVAWAAAAAFLLLLGAGAVAAVRGTRARRARRWVRDHVRVVPGAAAPPVSAPAASGRPGTPPDHVVRIEPHHDDGVHTVEEVHS